MTAATRQVNDHGCVRYWRGLGTFAIGVALSIFSACGDDFRDEYDPLSDECDRCLSVEQDGCGTPLAECEANAVCKDHIYCQLLAHCYETAPDSSCTTDSGCALPSDVDSETGAAAEAFEQCARIDCGESCGFVAP